MTAISLESHRSVSSRQIGPLVERVLDDMQITEREYHHLSYSMPLVVDIARRAARLTNRGDRVLLIGGNSLLAGALLRMGLEVDLWQFPQGKVPDGMRENLRRTVTTSDLEGCDLSDENFRLIIVPFIIESLATKPSSFLKSLRKGLDPEGAIIVATANQSRLDTRLAAITGRRFAVRRDGVALSLSWPSLPTLHEYHMDDLVESGRAAGFRIVRKDYVTANRLFMEMEPLPIEAYVARRASYLLRDLAPSARDTIVVELAPRAGEGHGWAPGTRPVVSVIVSAVRGGESLRSTLDALREQTYPAGSFRVTVIHDGGSNETNRVIREAAAAGPISIEEFVSPDVEGPLARNQAMAQADGDISAHIDDLCQLPQDWIEAAVTLFDDDTAVVSGPVFPLPGSEPRFLEVPGLRPDPGDKGIYREDLYPVYNVFYRTAVVLAAGGFKSGFTNGGSASAGWDAELSWRLKRGGWRSVFRQEVYLFRQFPPNPEGWAKDQLSKAEQMPGMYKAVPEIGDTALTAGIFASRQTMYFDLMLAAGLLALRRRDWRWLILSFPWLGAISQRLDLWPPQQWKGSARMAARIGLRHAVWLAGFLKGSIKARRLLL